MARMELLADEVDYPNAGTINHKKLEDGTCLRQIMREAKRYGVVG